MKNQRISIKPHIFFVNLLLVALSHSASAAVFDYLTQSLTIEPNSISITTEGVTATATAHHVEFDGGTSIIYGPFTTGNVGSRQVFGTNTSGIGNSGLGLTSVQDLGQTDSDIIGGGIQPGFDNFGNSPFVLPDVFPSIQFVLFSFDSPVDVSQVVVDDVSNFDRDIWVAGGNSAPNLSSDIVSAFSGFTILNSGDDFSDGKFTHTFTTLKNIHYLAIGTALPSTVGDVGGFAQGLPTGGSQFYINALNFEKSVGSVAQCLPGDSAIGTVSPNLDIHIPSLNYQSISGNQNLWANFEYYGRGSNGELLWKLIEYKVIQ